MRNAFRARGRGRTTLFASDHRRRDRVPRTSACSRRRSRSWRQHGRPGGQLAVLALVTSTIAFGSLAARAASSEAVRAGTPENEFLLARPVSLHSAGRRRAAWRTPSPTRRRPLPVAGADRGHASCGGWAPWRWPMAIAISMLMQIAISTLAYAVQLAVVRYVPAAGAAWSWTGLRLVAALSLATLWMLGTWVMRAPAALATKVAAIGAGARVLAGDAGERAAGGAGARPSRGTRSSGCCRCSAAPSPRTMLLAVAIARRAGMAGWEEAGAVWAEATRAPAPTARLPTAATKDLRLIVRDRSQLLALIAMPVIFIGVQVFGAAGWGWTTANLGRISCFAYSLALYMGTIGPLTHMQAERRAFWILRTVPVPLSQPARREGARLGGHRRRHRGDGVRRDVAVGAEYVGRRAARGGTARDRGGGRDELHRRRDGQRRRRSVRRNRHGRGAVDDLRVPVRGRAVQPRSGGGRRDTRRRPGCCMGSPAGRTGWRVSSRRASASTRRWCGSGGCARRTARPW